MIVDRLNTAGGTYGAATLWRGTGTGRNLSVSTMTLADAEEDLRSGVRIASALFRDKPPTGNNPLALERYHQAIIGVNFAMAPLSGSTG